MSVLMGIRRKTGRCCEKIDVVACFVCMLFLTVFGRSDSNTLRLNTIVFKSTLDSLVKESIADNPSLKAVQYKTEASKAAVNAIQKLDPPQAGVEFYQAPISSFPNPLKDQQEIDYALQQMIPFPGKRSSMANVEQNRTDMLGMDQQTTKQEIIRSVKTAFYEMYLIDRKLDINKVNQALVRSFIDIARKQYEVGAGKQTDILRGQTELFNLMNDSLQLTQNRRSVAAIINSLRNKPVGPPIASIPEIAPPIAPLPTIDSLLQVAQDNRPELKSMKYNIAMQDGELKSAQKEYYPDFMVRGTYKQMRNQEDDWALMLAATLPVAPWSIGKYSAGVDRAKAQIEQSQSEYTNMQNMIAAQVQDALSKVRSGQEQIDLEGNTIIPQARQTLQSAIAAYQTGGQDFLSLVDAQQTLLLAEQDYQVAVMNLITNQANLERATGTLNE